MQQFGVDFTSATCHWEHSILETVDALRNEGAVVLKGIVPHKKIGDALQVIETLAPLNDPQILQCILTSSSFFDILADATVMTMCDGVIGSQV